MRTTTRISVASPTYLPSVLEVASHDYTFFVDNEAGQDYQPGTALQPKRTIEGVRSALPTLGHGHAIRIYVKTRSDGGFYTTTDGSTHATLALTGLIGYGELTIRATHDLLTVETDVENKLQVGFLPILGGGGDGAVKTTAAATVSYVDVLAASIVGGESDPNGLLGYRIHMLTGPAAGYRANLWKLETVGPNKRLWFSLDAPIAPTPGGGDTFQLEEPGAKFVDLDFAGTLMADDDPVGGAVFISDPTILSGYASRAFTVIGFHFSNPGVDLVYPYVNLAVQFVANQWTARSVDFTTMKVLEGYDAWVDAPALAFRRTGCLNFITTSSVTGGVAAGNIKFTWGGSCLIVDINCYVRNGRLAVRGPSAQGSIGVRRGSYAGLGLFMQANMGGFNQVGRGGALGPLRQARCISQSLIVRDFGGSGTNWVNGFEAHSLSGAGVAVYDTMKLALLDISGTGSTYGVGLEPLDHNEIRNSEIQSDHRPAPPNKPSVTGPLGDFRMHGDIVIPWSDIDENFWREFVDRLGNVLMSDKQPAGALAESISFLRRAPQLSYYKNGSGSLIPFGTPVRVSGNGVVTPAQADSVAHMKGYIGVATHTWATGAGKDGGMVARAGLAFGKFKAGLGALVAGDAIYVDDSAPGQYTNVPPAVPTKVGVVSDTTQYGAFGMVIMDCGGPS